MEITFSRHAQRRAKLYKIPESTILEMLKEKHLAKGIQEIIEHVVGRQYPLKIILAVEELRTTIVTVYPLKRGRKT